MSPVAVCTLDQLDEDFPFVVQVDGVEVAIVRTQGALYAIKNECSHADVALSEGEVDDCHLECWMHGSRFNLRTGVPDSLPATRNVPVYVVSLESDAPNSVVLVDVTTDASLVSPPSVSIGLKG
ncbi:MAG: non-heme iron oxygenase ferredoxin subunit [Actinomycetes bacterium]